MINPKAIFAAIFIIGGLLLSGFEVCSATTLPSPYLSSLAGMPANRIFPFKLHPEVIHFAQKVGGKRNLRFDASLDLVVGVK